MHGVARWERIESAAGKRDTMQVAAHGAPVRPHLIEVRFQKVRQQNRSERRQQHMIACVTLWERFGARPEPPSQGERCQNMFVCSPRQGGRDPFRQRTGVSRYRAREFDIGG
jgi:hypothetical protein